LKIDGSIVSKRMLLSIFLTFISFILFDLSVTLFDFSESVGWMIEVCEVLVLLSGSILFVSLWRSIDQRNLAHEKLLVLQNTLNSHRLVNEKLKKDFQSFIHDHFTAWGLSESEKDIGQFLLKGLSFKDIADIRKVSEKTIRNQCLSIYSKSGLPGKHELAIFFLEELTCGDSLQA
jgi:DNA-binding CsgD family transcriptional regulator